VVLNGVVLISSVRDLPAQRKSAEEAAVRGALLRLLPVLMTALVASFGFIFMALATSTLSTFGTHH
jgi:heavy metal efflux system protein